VVWQYFNQKTSPKMGDLIMVWQLYDDLAFWDVMQCS
jgi:hypothetical protein